TRPVGLTLCAPKSQRTRFPRAADLDCERNRGRVLHFFANHELLALELMALTLLRFPKAPSRLRRCLIATMRDEQKHMRLYLEQMQHLGVEFGEIPLNSFFWDLLSKVESVDQFVAGMSLTFEQANIDFSLFYKEQFELAGDRATAAIMQTVLQDEIAHVRHGVNFFRADLEPEESLWKKYTDALVYPLTPARAKGRHFSKSHRRQAGLDDTFIDQLEVFTHSKGRVPDVFIFNPWVERSIAHGSKGYTASRATRSLTADLETLPMFICSPEDVVLVENEIDTPHLSTLKSLGYHIPEFISSRIHGGTLKRDHPLVGRKLNRIQPWGWTPDLAHTLKPLEKMARAHGEPFIETAQKLEPLYSKTWLTEQADRWLEALSPPIKSHIITTPLPMAIDDRDTIQREIDALTALGFKTIVIKAPLGTSGGAQLKVLHGKITNEQWTWINRILKKQKSVIIEPWYTNVLDASYLFKITSDGRFREIGLTHFFTDAQGRYRGTALGNLGDTAPTQLKPFIFQAGGNAGWISRTLKAMVQALLPELIKGGAIGCHGLDVMVVRLDDGTYKLRAPLELNPRQTMGHIAKGIARPFGTRTRGLWLIITQADLKAAGVSTFPALLSTLQHALPATFKGDPPRLVEGVFATTSVTAATSVCSFCFVSKEFGKISDLVERLFGHTMSLK
ncbi:MAG: DUF455 family protein, partial [Bradymonadia bacterium]